MNQKDLKKLTMMATGSGLSRRALLQAGAATGLMIAAGAMSGARAAGPTKGGHVRIGADGGATTDALDPLMALGADHPQNVVFSIYDTLVELDPESRPQPSLAEGWESDDKGTWLIRLRQGVEFHNGKPLTPADVVWSLQQHLREDAKNAEATQIVGNLEEIRADGPNTVLLKQKEINFDLPSHLSSFGLIIAPEGTEDWDAGVGTGPYVKETYEPGVRFLGKKFDKFYRDDQGHFETVEILNVTDPAARTLGLMSDSLDAAGSPEIATASRLAAAPGHELISISGTQHYTTDMRTDTGPLTDPNLRNAIKWGVKRQEIIDKVLAGYGTLGNDIPLARTQLFYNDQLPQRAYDPDQARFYLKKAGLDGARLTLNTSDGAFPGAVNMALLMQQALGQLGIDVEVKRQPADGYWSDVWRVVPWSASYYAGRPTADWMLSSQYASTSEWDATYFKNEKFDALLAQARAEPDESKRRDLYFEAQRLLWEDGGVLIPAFANILIGASKKLGHGAVGVSRRLDDARLARRWWYEGCGGASSPAYQP